MIRSGAIFGIFLSASFVLADEPPLPQPAAPAGPVQGDGLEKPSAVIRPPGTEIIVVPDAPPQMRGVDEEAYREKEQAIVKLESRLIDEQMRRKIAVAYESGNASLLKQIILMGGPVDTAVSRAEKPPTVPAGPLALVGLEKDAKVSKSLEHFFGAPMTPASEKELLDTVKSHLTGKDKPNVDVQIVGWWPAEGVMAVSVANATPKS